MENKFAQQLVKLRQKNKLSQEDLANQLYISRQAVSKWENGSATPDLDKLIQLTQIFDVSMDELIFAQHLPQTPSASPTGTMNGWDFLSRYWWAVIALLAVLGGVIPQIVHAFK